MLSLHLSDKDCPAYGPLLVRLIRSRPSGFFTFPALARSDILAIEFFLQRMEKECFDFEQIKHIEYDPVADISLLNVDFEKPCYWRGNFLHGFQILKEAQGASTRKEPSYSIHGGILHAFDGLEGWNCVVDLTKYRLFSWDDNALRMTTDGTVDVMMSSHKLTTEFKDKMLSDIFDTLKEMKSCVKK